MADADDYDDYARAYAWEPAQPQNVRHTPYTHANHAAHHSPLVQNTETHDQTELHDDVQPTVDDALQPHATDAADAAADQPAPLTPARDDGALDAATEPADDATDTDGLGEHPAAGGESEPGDVASSATTLAKDEGAEVTEDTGPTPFEEQLPFGEQPFDDNFEPFDELEAGALLPAGEKATEAPFEADASAPMSTEKPAPVVCSKPKRAMSAFFFWLREKHGGRPSTGAGHEWAQLADEEKAPFAQAAAADKERYAGEMAVYTERLSKGEICAPDDPDGPASLVFPIARLRKMMSTVEPKRFTKEAVFVLGKTVETVVELLAEHCGESARRANRKAVVLQDFGKVIYGAKFADFFAFLHSEFPRRVVTEARPRAERAAAATKKAAAAEVEKLQAAEGSARVTSFFATGEGPWKPSNYQAASTSAEASVAAPKTAPPRGNATGKKVAAAAKASTASAALRSWLATAPPAPADGADEPIDFDEGNESINVRKRRAIESDDEDAENAPPNEDASSRARPVKRRAIESDDEDDEGERAAGEPMDVADAAQPPPEVVAA